MSKAKVGHRIKTFREKQGLSLEEFSSRTGLGVDFLEAVEEKEKYPSLGPLLKIARALGVRLGTFLDDQVSKDPLIVKLGERKEEFAMHSDQEKTASMKYFSLAKGKSDRHMEPFFIEIQPEDGEPKLTSHEGEEFIIVVSGKLKVVYGKEESVLEAGDSVYFNSVVPHYVAADGNEKCDIYAVLYFPE
ncbi:helix-turn-helix domain-containing protein [Maridesulfovibrio salexigens]|uniref:Transcriptional regulator, XRE family n=1 Tax=Maridesulfovibrio salexigens (strain ATCC 14822 / DSM 2638 / NCIMB 8403 / VKM B-1763) TaxID=526222 RepID=C6BVK6_MARSD|nr:XRE family transcriptional regulator [Maridesulfovibrio salexigens]ACS78220.1 transcriptional regulator, XRE family [Maridesulfovibrio salexigens DSM 2638]